MVESHGDEAANEPEIVQMIGVDVRGRIDLQTVVILGRVLKQTVHGIEDLVREQEEPLACHATVVKALFALERQEELSSQIVRVQFCNLQ